jgi:hypothetical protein
MSGYVDSLTGEKLTLPYVGVPRRSIQAVLIQFEAPPGHFKADYATWLPNRTVMGYFTDHTGEKAQKFITIDRGFITEHKPELLALEQITEPPKEHLIVDFSITGGINTLEYTISYQGRIIHTHRKEKSSPYPAS